MNRFVIAIVMAVVAASCSRGTSEYEIAGRHYCVPDEYSVSDVPWVPDSPQYSGAGFAFDGCQEQTDSADCPLPPRVDGGTFGESTTVGNWNLERFPPDAHYARILRDPMSRAEIVSNSLAIVSSSETTDWLVVRVGEASQSQAQRPHIYEELVAVCGDRIDYRGEGSSRRSFIRCSRHVIRDKFGLSYGFESTSRTPVDVATLDEQIFSALDSWRCETE